MLKAQSAFIESQTHPAAEYGITPTAFLLCCWLSYAPNVHVLGCHIRAFHTIWRSWFVSFLAGWTIDPLCCLTLQVSLHRKIALEPLALMLVVQGLAF